LNLGGTGAGIRTPLAALGLGAAFIYWLKGIPIPRLLRRPPILRAALRGTAIDIRGRGGGGRLEIAMFATDC